VRVAARKPTGNSQGEQCGSADAGHNQRFGRRTLRSSVVNNNGTQINAAPAPASTMAVVMSRDFIASRWKVIGHMLLLFAWGR